MRNRINRNQAVLCEALEGRRLLAGNPVVEGVAEIQAGTLQVTGTKQADVITVGNNPSDPTMVDVNLNGTVIGSYLLSDITSGAVEIHAGKGDDSVRFDESMGLVPLRMIAHGQQGNDTLVGGALNDELHGDQGSDSLFGNDGNDELYGGNSHDTLAGGFGDDHAEGGNGKDTLYGEAGFDTLAGGNGKDLVDGGDDNDNIDGGRGKDSVTGGLGVDTFASADKAEEILDKADEDIYVVLAKGKGKGATA